MSQEQKDLIVAAAVQWSQAKTPAEELLLRFTLLQDTQDLIRGIVVEKLGPVPKVEEEIPEDQRFPNPNDPEETTWMG